MVKYKQTSEDSNMQLNEPAMGGITSFFLLSSQTVSKSYIKKVLKLSKLSVTELISILPISIDTYKRKVVFNNSVTEKVLEIEEVYRKGLDAFGDSFYVWMVTENIALGGTPPKALLQNSFGIRLLLDEIGKLEHGVLA